MTDTTESSRAYALLGGTVTVVMYDVEPPLSDHVFDLIHDEGLRLQSVFNLFDDSSELNRLNRRRSMRVSGELLAVLREGIRFGRLTQGRFDITKGRQFLARKRHASIPPVQCSYQDIRIVGDLVELLHPDILLDLGSIAKGFIADMLARFLMQEGIESGYVDARGDIRFFGSRISHVAIQHPRVSDSLLHPFTVGDGAVATSGDYRQFDTEYRRSHILGQQVFASVTAIAPTAMEADAIATCVFVMDKEEVDAFMSRVPHAHVLAYDLDMHEYVYAAQAGDLGGGSLGA